MTWRCRPSAENERGASIIEFALLSSVMFVMLFGILSYGEVLADLCPASPPGRGNVAPCRAR